MNNTKSASIFVNGLRTNPGPWHIKTVGSANNPEYQLCDFHGKPFAYILPPHPDNSTVEQFQHNRNALKNLPLTMAALLEATYTLHNLGYPPSQGLIDLIRDSGGPDLTDSVSQTNEEN